MAMAYALATLLMPTIADAATQPAHATDTQAAASRLPIAPEVAALPDPQVFSYQSNGLTLKGWISKPAGTGPFPVIFANHGSEQQPIRDKALAAFWVKQGFIYFKPIRSGHGGNPGPYIGDEIKPCLLYTSPSPRD